MMKQLFFFATLAVATTGSAQKANRISFQNGQKLEVVTETKKTTNMELMGQQMEATIHSTLTESYDVEKAGPDSAVIEYKVKRLVFNTTGGMGAPQSFDSEKEGDRNGELGKLLEKGLKNKYSMTVDAQGNVLSVRPDDDNPNGKEKTEQDAVMEMITAQLGFSFGLPKQGDATIFKLLPSREVRLNESWTDSSSADGQKRTTVYKVAKLDNNEIVLDYTETIDMETTQEMMGVQARVKSTDKSTGKITLDRKTGLLKQKTFTMDTQATTEAQGMTIPATGTTTVTITVKGV